MSKPSRSSGFTVVELLVIVVIIGVLLGVVALAYQGVLARNRNQDRAKSVNAIQKQLEAYYQTEQHYPSLANLNDTDWLGDNLSGLDLPLLQDPNGTEPSLAPAPAIGSYAYQTLNSSGGSCEDDAETCMTYTLTATLEGGGTYVKQNRN